MEDFKNSVAHLDIDVATAVTISSVVGDNFYKFMYITNETGTSLDSATTPTLITADSYSDIVDSLSIADEDKVALIKKNLASVFDYAPNAQGYIISASKYSEFKYYAYWCYLETEYEIDSSGTADALVFSSKTEDAFAVIDVAKDPAFSGFIADLAIDAGASVSQAPSSLVDDFLETLGALTFKLGLFARGATDEFAWKDETLSIGYSPALYQLGRTLGFINASGTPIGNSIDTVACAFQDVLPTRNTSTSILVNASALFVNWCQANHIAYFKTVGNGTAQVSCYGGWTLKITSLVADWIVAYVNFMTRVACAEIVTGMNVYKNSLTYGKCLAAMSSKMAPFISIGRVYNYSVMAPSWQEAQSLSDRESIVIPHAWEAWYADDVRKVKIQGELHI